VDPNRPEAETALVASFWTLAGDLRLEDLGPSPWSLEQRAAAAAEAGYAGIGIDHRDVAAYLAGAGLSRMRNIIDRTGLSFVELELITGWYDITAGAGQGSGGAGRAQVAAQLLQAAEVVGARHVKIGGGLVDTGVSTEALVEAFAAICARAASAGAEIVLELLPGGPFRTLERAVDVVTTAGAPNGGLLLDAWHVQRAGISTTSIAKLTPGLLRFVEVCDGAATSSLPLLEDTTTNRLLCGEGEFDLDGFIRATRAAGYIGPYGVEILSAALRSRPLAEVAQRSADTAKAVISASISTNTEVPRCAYSSSAKPNLTGG
jgi:sugar phosphate isomerase/epimerase